MAVKVMEALRERSDVTLIIRLRDGRTLIIRPGTALALIDGVVCYSLEDLLRYYMENYA